jgi:uncharacterized protein VirK/YbjX
MGIKQIILAGRLWMDAVNSRWALREVSGDSRWQLALHMASWARLFIRQTQWLCSLHAREPMWRAAKADPRLFERWHRPYISRHFNVAARRRILNGHYTFVMQRFPAWLSERIVLGSGTRLTTVRLDDASCVHLHLRKPSRADAGELNLLLLTEDKQVLASCILTFDRRDSLIIGALRGAGPHAPFEATGEFIRGSHGLRPTDLLMSLVRELAALHGLKRIRAVTSAACIDSALREGGVDGDDAFWEAQGGLAAGSGCHELPLSLAQVRCTDGPRNCREKHQRREAFRKQACEGFAAAFRRVIEPPPGRAEMPIARGHAVAARGQTPAKRKHATENAGLLATGR